MYKRFLSAAFLVLSLVVNPLMSFSAQALSPLSNALIKLDGSPTVYWLATDNKRYVFPNPRTFYSWFTPEELSRVVTLTPQQMGNIALGGNVTYRPGVRLVKVTTDPRVYAVSRYGVLRWITSEALAQQLYGQNWAQQVDDVPDEFFFNYRIGDPIYTSSQFNVPFEMGQARSPSDNIQNNSNWPNPPAASRGQAVLSVSNSAPQLNEAFTLSATVQSFSASSGDTRISLYQAESGILLRTCTGWYCESTTGGMYQTRDIGNSYRFFARVTNALTGESIDSATISITVRGIQTNSGYPTISANTTAPSVGQTVTVTANTNTIDPRNGTLMVVGPTGAVVQTCSYSSTCTYSFIMDAATADMIRTSYQGYYAFSARFLPLNGAAINSNQLNVYAPTVNANIPGTSMVLTFDRTEARVGQLFNVVATIRPESTGAPFYTIRIYDQWNVLQHTCVNVRVCTLQQILSPTTDPNRTYYATATGDNGQQLSSGNQTIVVQPTTQPSSNAHIGNSQLTLGMGSENTLALVPYMTVNSGQEVRLTASLEPASSDATGITIKFIDGQGQTLTTCTNYRTCGTTRTLSNGTTQDITLGFKARVEDTYGGWYETPVSYVIVRPVSTNNAGTFSATLFPSVNPTTVKSSDTFFLSGEVKGYNSPTEKLGVSWYEEDGSLITTCYGREVCSVGTTYYANNGTRTMKFYFEAWDTSGARTGTLRSDLKTVTIIP